MPSIAGNSVSVFRGRLHLAERHVGIHQPEPGVDGSALALGAWHTTPDEISTAVETSSASNAMSIANAYRSFHGSAVSVVDQFGIVWSYVVVLSVRSEISQLGNGRFRVDAWWSLLPQWTAA